MLFDIDSGTDPDEIDLGDCKNSIHTPGAASRMYMAMFPLPTNNIKWTFSCWVKRSKFGVATSIFGTSTVLTNVDKGNIGFNSSNQLIFTTTTGYWNFTTNRVFIDSSAWTYLQINYDSAQAVSTNRVKIYINDAQELDFATATYPTISRASTINAVDQPHQIGFSGSLYLANVCFIDGESLDPSYFGSKSTEYNEWRSVGHNDLAYLCSSYGTSSFFLDFRHGAAIAELGYDASTHGNNFTVASYVLTGAATNWYQEGPGNTYATLSTAQPGAPVYSNGGLTFTGTTSPATVVSDRKLTGKVYFEAKITGAVNTAYIGIAAKGAATSPGSASASSFGLLASSGLLYYSGSSQGTVLQTCASGDTVMVAFERTTRTIWFGKNGVWYGSPSAGTGGKVLNASPFSDYTHWFFCVGNSGTTTIECNFGQRPFSYTVPAGFKSLCVLNNTPVTIKNPSEHFDVLLDTGANIKAAADARYPNSIQFIKDCANAASWQVCDSVRGLNNALKLPSASGGQVSFSNPAGASVAYVFNTVTDPAANNQGTIATTVSGNTVAGISAMRYTTVGAVGGVTTYGHGAGKRPDFVLAKLVGSGTLFGWPVWTNASTGNTAFYGFTLDRLAAPVSSQADWGRGGAGTVSSTLISYDSNTDCTYQGYDPGIAYCFNENTFFTASKVYAGNASTDGPVVWLGFRPKLVVIKATSSYTSGNWIFVDSVRSPGNYVNESLSTNTTGAEVVATSSTGAYIQFLATGFKICSTHADVNASGTTYSVLAVSDVHETYALAR